MVNIIKKTLATLLMAGTLLGGAGCAGPRTVNPFEAVARGITAPFDRSKERKRTDEEIERDVDRKVEKEAAEIIAKHANARAPPFDYRVGEYLQQNKIPILRSMADYNAFVNGAGKTPVVLLAYGRFDADSAAEAKAFVIKRKEFGGRVICGAIADDAEGLAGIVGLLPTRNGSGIIIVKEGKIQDAKPYSAVDAALAPYLAKK